LHTESVAGTRCARGAGAVEALNAGVAGQITRAELPEGKPPRPLSLQVAQGPAAPGALALGDAGKGSAEISWRGGGASPRLAR
jgi:hypothetical protein